MLEIGSLETKHDVVDLLMAALVGRCMTGKLFVYANGEVSSSCSIISSHLFSLSSSTRPLNFIHLVVYLINNAFQSQEAFLLQQTRSIWLIVPLISSLSTPTPSLSLMLKVLLLLLVPSCHHLTKQPLHWTRLESTTRPPILEDVDAASPCPVLSPEDNISPINSPDAFPPATPPFRFRTGDEYMPPLVWGKTAADGYSPRPLALLGEIQSPPPKFSMTANGVTAQASLMANTVSLLVFQCISFQLKSQSMLLLLLIICCGGKSFRL